MKPEKPSTSKIIDALGMALGFEASGGGGEIVPYEAAAPCLNAEGNLVPVDYARQARTTTTLSWVDGYVDTAFVTAPFKSMPKNVADEMNKELAGVP